MIDSPAPPRRTLEPLEREAHAWVRRLASGAARPRDAQALRRWCATSAAHAEAFRNASRQWRELQPAAQLAAAQDPVLAALRGDAARAVPDRSRRVFLGGAAAAAAVAGIAWLRPPLDLWPSARAQLADYRTAVGERRQLALAPDVAIEMNTRSSLTVRALTAEQIEIELIDGEIAVEAGERPVIVAAGDGRLQALSAYFEIRHLNGQVCVTCARGQVAVRHGGQRTLVPAERQLAYDNHSVTPVRSVNLADWSAWREGVLRFQQTALAEVVSEINRYRPGRLVVLGEGLEKRPVSGRFRIGDLDKAIAQIQHLFRLRATALPGGFVVLR